MRHLNNGTDHRHSKSCCDQSSPARWTMMPVIWDVLAHCGVIRDMLMPITKPVMPCSDVLPHGEQIVEQRVAGSVIWDAMTLMRHCSITKPEINICRTWWRHQMEAFSALLALCAGNSSVPGEFPTQRPVTRSFGVLFHLRPNKTLIKQWRGWWFKTPSCPLWHHCDELRWPRRLSPAFPDSVVWSFAFWTHWGREKWRPFLQTIFSDAFSWINIWISIKILLKFVSYGLIDNIPSLVQMAWHRPGDKPLSEPMMVNLLTHIHVTGPQWINVETSLPNGMRRGGAYVRHFARCWV